MKIREYYQNTLKQYSNNTYLSDIVLRSLILNHLDISDMSRFYFILEEELLGIDELNKKLKRVLDGEPYQYVINSQTFLNENYYVDSRVLIPRMETEELVMTLINLLKTRFKNNSFCVADIGTGSGCIAISLKKTFPHARILAIDIIDSALEVAKKNAYSLNADIEFLQGDLLNPILEKKVKLDVLVSNPPYISNINEIDESVWKYEPHEALLSKNLYFYEEILKNVSDVMQSEGIIAFEFNYDQKELLLDLIKKYIPSSNYIFYQDAFKKWRYVIIEYKK